MRLRRFFQVFALLFLVISPASVSHAGASSPEAFVKEMASRTMGAIASPDITREERRKIFREMLDDHFDMATISRFVLGRYWRVATAEQKKRYRTLLDEALINVYTDRFDDYKGEGFEVLGQRAEGNDVLVFSQIVPIEAPPVKVDWRIRKEGKQYKVIDVIVQDISMVVTKRSDFASVIQRGGGNVEVLLDHLEENQQQLL